MNSREKGKRGERQWRDELRAQGYAAKRGQQFAGSPDSPDVVCPGLPWAHFEVKLVEHLNIYQAMAQARRDCGGRAPFVAHRRNFWPWLVTMEAKRFYRLLRSDMAGNWAEEVAEQPPAVVCKSFGWLHCAAYEGRRHKLQEDLRCLAREAEGKMAALSHRRNGQEDWLVTMSSDVFFRLLRGDLPAHTKN